ncbi:MAG: SIS domain-containing protein, partial [FCB group bacterium]|nr:SIS domain-containing protein [FCB group bacterium]
MTSQRENSPENLARIAAQVLQTEANELIRASTLIGPSIVKTAKIILHHSGKIVVSGIGKSGHIGEKIVATLCSTGIQAVFVHAAEALHGDLGVYSPGDPTLIISKSGSTEELLRLIPILREFQSPLIGLLGKVNSPLAKRVDLVLDASVEKEADPLGIVPTSSTTLTMAIGDALAAVLMAYRKFEKKDFARFHPGGDLGRRLTLTVKDIMQPLSEVAVAHKEQHIREVVIAMTDNPQG